MIDYTAVHNHLSKLTIGELHELDQLVKAEIQKKQKEINHEIE